MQDQDTIDAYNTYAQTYDEEVTEFWNNFPDDFLEEFVTNLPGKRILDVGSGSGRDAMLLHKHGLEVVCVDASQAMISITTELGFESYLTDFAHIDFPQESFDGLWAYTSLIHITKASAYQAIQHLRPLLKPSGTFAIGVIEGSAEGMVERKTMPGTTRYFKNYTPQEIRGLIEPLGFHLLYESKYQPRNSIYLNQVYKLNR